MSLEITGRLVKIMPEQTGSGKNGNWVKQEFVIETAEQYPKKVCFSLWGDKTSVLKSVSQGDELKVFFNVESREYNERFYTDLRAWRVETVASQPNDGSISSTDGEVSTFFADESDNDELPF